jgi:hypothetical protein
MLRAQRASGNVEVRPHSCCLQRHPTHFQQHPSVRDLPCGSKCASTGGLHRDILP